MKESTTYQAIKEEGRLEELREDIRRLGERKFNRGNRLNPLKQRRKRRIERSERGRQALGRHHAASITRIKSEIYSQLPPAGFDHWPDRGELTGSDE